jgi:hypothetical protein
MEDITVRLKFQEFTDHLECEPSGGIKIADNAAFGDQPQGYGWRIDWQETQQRLFANPFHA